jgi:wyosine [tRNA(Phe)-imidazoG37] synthetase (radical SAM superfamily)
MDKLLQSVPLNGFAAYPGVKIPDDDAKRLGGEFDQAKYDAKKQEIENNIQKLDTVSIDYIRRVDRPTSKAYNVGKVIENLKLFHGHVIIQTMFLHGCDADNTSEEFVGPWIEAVKAIAPESVMIYTVDRETPMAGLKKASREELNAIRDRVIAEGIPCSASY